MFDPINKELLIKVTCCWAVGVMIVAWCLIGQLWRRNRALARTIARKQQYADSFDTFMNKMLKFFDRLFEILNEAAAKVK